MEWIGVDLDGTLAEYHGWKGENIIGDPIPAMVKRVKQWIADGKTVKIFTARVGINNTYSPESKCIANKAFAIKQKQIIQKWCLEHIGKKLDVTAIKDFEMVALWDDRCIQVIPNTGMPIKDLSTS